MKETRIELFVEWSGSGREASVHGKARIGDWHHKTKNKLVNKGEDYLTYE